MVEQEAEHSEGAVTALNLSGYTLHPALIVDSHGFFDKCLRIPENHTPPFGVDSRKPAYAKMLTWGLLTMLTNHDGRSMKFGVLSDPVILRGLGTKRLNERQERTIISAIDLYSHTKQGGRSTGSVATAMNISKPWGGVL